MNDTNQTNSLTAAHTARAVPPDDERIIQLFFSRSEKAVEQTQRKYGALCRSVMRRILADPRDIDECLSDLYLRIWNTIPPEHPRSLQAFVARIARNLALDRYAYNTAAQRNSALTDAFEELEPWLPDPEGDPGYTVDAQSFRTALNKFLRRQTVEARTFFLRRYWYGETIREISKECGVSEAKVKSSLFRTRERLRTMLDEERITI